MGDISSITLPNGDIYNFKDVKSRQAIPFGEVDSTSTSTVFTATVPGITELKDGTIVLLKNGVVTSASGFTININGLGAKPVYSNMSAATRETTLFNVNYTLLLIYDEDRVSGGCWINYRGYYSDANSIGYQLRTNNTVMTVTDTARYYKLYFTSANGKQWVPASVNSTNNATSARAVNQRPIDPFGRIVYTSASTNYTAGSNLAAATTWSQYAIVLGYSFNRTGAALVLTTKTPVYIKCAPQTDGSAIIDADTPYVQALPSIADGKIYIFLGIAYDETHVELFVEHPVYWHDGTGIRLWTGSATAAIDVDDALSSTSENPVQNKVITNALPVAATTAPIVDGTAAVGTSAKYAREDHVHPKATYTASEVGAIPAPESPYSGQILSYNNGAWIADDLNILLNDTEALQVNITENSGTWHIDMDVTDLRDAFLSARKLLFVTVGNNLVSSFEPVGFDLQNGTVELACIGGMYNYQRLTFHPNLTDGGMDGTLELIPTGADKITQPVSASSGDILTYNGSAWVASTKPTYTANEVGALPNTTVIPSAATVAPLGDGTAAVGTSTKYAREDHVHPTDTSRAPLASPALTGTPTAPTATAGTNNTQIATTAFVNSMVAIVKSTGANSGAGGDLNYTDASGLNSLAYGSSATASGEGAVAFSGAIASGDFSLSHGRQWANANYTTTASGAHSLAFGLSAKAEGNESVSVGQGTTATGNFGVALGNQTTAGGGAFAMGQKSSATGTLSATIGNELLAPGRNAFVIGQYNIEDTDDGSNYTDYGSGAKKYVFTVGNGTKVNNVVTRSNALTLDWNGNLEVNSAKLNNLNLPTTSGGSSYGPGTSGQIVKSNGSTNYWGTLSTSELTNDSGFITGMYIGSYGHSTYAEILAAYKANKVVYCRASNSANPATGNQTRMAFLAYVNNPETPTTFEFQYYRSVSTHTESQQGDQVYVYTLTSAGTWSVVVRSAFSAVAAGTGLSRSYSSGTVTLSVSSPLPSVTSSDNGKVLTVVNGAWETATGGSIVPSHSATGNYAKILTFEAAGENVTAPITMEFIRTGDTRPTEIMLCFGSGGTLTSFTSNNVTNAYLHYNSSIWTLYIGKASASDKVEVLDFHNPWSNTDLAIEWNDTSISTLPTGATQASIASIPNSYGDLKGTGEHIYESPSSISIANGATKTVGSITLSEGVWLLIGMAQFNTNATGRRKAYFANSSDSETDLGAIYKDTQRAVDGDSTQCSVVAYYANTSSSKTLYFIATQNSGSTITTTSRLMAIKIA